MMPVKTTKETSGSVLADPTKPSSGHKITFTLYGTEGEDHAHVFKEINNIVKIVAGFSRAAQELQQKILEVEILLNLIPKTDYENHEHINAREDFFFRFNHLLLRNTELIRCENIKIDITDVYFTLFKSSDSKISRTKAQCLLWDLKVCGTVADLPKTYALICDKNKYKKHLQLDTNTNISNYAQLYEATFMTNKDAFFAMAYGEHHISVQNKVVYVTPKGKFVEKLRESYNRFFSARNFYTGDETSKKKSNNIFSEIFAPALLASKVAKTTPVGPYKPNAIVFYSADFTTSDFMETYRITKYVIPAINKSWSDDEVPTVKAAYEKFHALFPTVTINSNNYNSKSIHYLIKVLTGTAMNRCPEDVGKLLSLAESVNGSYLSIIAQYCAKLSTESCQKILAFIPESISGEKVKSSIVILITEQKAKQDSENRIAEQRRIAEEIKQRHIAKKAEDKLASANEVSAFGTTAAEITPGEAAHPIVPRNKNHKTTTGTWHTGGNNTKAIVVTKPLTLIELARQQSLPSKRM